MKHFSLKTKLTLLYTLLMTSVVCAIFAVLFSFSNQEILTGVSTQLEERVADARSDIVYVNGALEIDSDFLELKDGIFLYGKIPYGFNNTLPFADGNVRRIQSQNTQYYVLDMIYQIPGYGITDIRGIASVTAAEKNLSSDNTICTRSSSAYCHCHCSSWLFYDKTNASPSGRDDSHSTGHPRRRRFIKTDKPWKRK